ncbi:DUF2179 domain-containing protein [Marivirga atlantica]|jgi:uncharacterized protein YebE (UPF0316 family)|uniref:UPF0316 protein JKP34_01350 n=1 Tax=Marivirga atlantica TaxID=1548457 RepID=A0A937A804_9BACT|nr:DUF2179 domain-containing protein [Marivirga atlantica]MBL0763875.1 DUF2179 domain-containing protein [Marivirga atlantica]
MMEFFEQLGISNETFAFIVLPILIFLSRIGDVSIATIRVIFVLQGKKFMAPFLGFFESIIWLLAIGQIFKHIDNPVSYFAYAGGYAAGTYVGMWIEEKLALGSVVVRTITAKPAVELIDYFKSKNLRFSNIEAEGNNGKVNIIFTVVKRELLKELIPTIKKYNPKAFFTIEGVKKVSDEEISYKENKGIVLGKMLNFKRR